MRFLLSAIIVVLVLTFISLFAVTHSVRTSINEDYQKIYDNLVSQKDTISRALGQCFLFLDRYGVQNDPSIEKSIFDGRMIISHARATLHIDLEQLSVFFENDPYQVFQDLSRTLIIHQEATRKLSHAYDRLAKNTGQSPENLAQFIDGLREFVSSANQYDVALMHVEAVFSQKITTELGRMTQNILYILIGLILVFLFGTLMVFLRFRENKKNEQQLQKSRDQLNLVIKGSNDAPWDWDLKNNHLYYSPQWWQQIGYEPEKENTNPDLWKQMVHPDDVDHTNFVLENALAGNADSFEVECRLKHKAGHSVPVLCRGYISRDKQNRPVRISGTNMDLTQQKKALAEKAELQQQLTQAQKMESIGKLAGGIAHDFNNILYPVIGFTDLTMDALPDDHPVQEYLKNVKNGSIRARDLVKQILLFSRQKERQLKPYRIVPIIEETLKLLRSIMPVSVTIELRVIEKQGHVLCDATEIHEIMMNLCTNAYQAMEGKEGNIRVVLDKKIPAPELHLSAEHYLRLSVSDTGSGISNLIREKIFEPYFTTKPVGKGSGLGLSVVHGIVKKYKGEIRLISGEKQGATFEIYFPFHKGEVSESGPDSTNPDPAGKENILFVDDESAIVNLAAHTLNRMGYTVIGAGNGKDALKLFSEQPDRFDLVITDMAMPGMTGIELAERLMRIRSNIPVIICSGYSEELDQSALEKLRIKKIIDKPILTSTLAVHIRKVLDEK